MYSMGLKKLGFFPFSCAVLGGSVCLLYFALFSLYQNVYTRLYVKWFLISKLITKGESGSGAAKRWALVISIFFFFNLNFSKMASS